MKTITNILQLEDGDTLVREDLNRIHVLRSCESVRINAKGEVSQKVTLTWTEGVAVKSLELSLSPSTGAHAGKFTDGKVVFSRQGRGKFITVYVPE